MVVGSDLTLIETDRGNRLKLARTIQGSAEDAWDLLSKVSHWPNWGPLLTEVRYPHEEVRTDTTGNVQLLNLFRVPFRIIRVEKYYWSWTVAGLTPPSDGHRVEPAGPGSCRVSFELPIWGLPYLPICYFALRTIQRSLEAAEH